MNETESLLKAIEELLWATNQLQLTAFHENNRETCPRQAPPPPALPPSCPPQLAYGTTSSTEFKIFLVFFILFEVLFVVAFLYLVCSALFASAKREYIESRRKETQEIGAHRWRDIIESRDGREQDE